MPGKITVRNYTTLTDYAHCYELECTLLERRKRQKIMDSGLRLQRVKGWCSGKDCGGG